MDKKRLVLVIALTVTEMPLAIALQSERLGRGDNVFAERFNAPPIPPPERNVRKLTAIVGRRHRVFELKRERRPRGSRRKNIYPNRRRF